MKRVDDEMKIDIHSHVLPGIDDGAKDWDMCLSMLEASAKCGVTKIIATPHFLPWKHNAKPDEIRQLCKEAKEKLERKLAISMDIYPGHEIYYNLEVIEKLKMGKILTLADSRYILVEFEPSVSYQVICRAVKDFRDNAYVPIIAHTERYACLRQSERMEEMKRMGAMFQVNVEAFQRGMFDATSRWVKKNLLKETIDFLASDMHDMRRRPPLSEEKLRWIQKRLKPAYQKELLCVNGQKVLNENKA